MSKISIILPVYNVEKFLVQCLDSIINQTFTDFECICVNDGSTDSSLKILEEYSNKDERIKLINQINSGPSVARNNGLKVSTGQYIAFVDSDDFISRDYLEKLMEVAERENSDIVYCGHKLFYLLDDRFEQDRNKEKIKLLFNKYNNSKNGNDKIKYVLDIVEKARSICMKLYKASVIKDNSIYFFEKIYAEMDYSFNILVNLFSDKISLLNEELYFYRKQVKSITTNIEKFRVNAINSFIFLTKELNNRKILKDNKLLQNFVVSNFIYNIGKQIPKSKQQEMYIIILEHFKYLKKNLDFSCLRNTKISFYILIMKIFKLKSLVFFRILKNF